MRENKINLKQNKPKTKVARRRVAFKYQLTV